MGRRLIPVLVLALLGGLLWWTSRDSASPLHQVESDVSLCKHRLRAIYAGLLLHEERFGTAPTQSGSLFLGSLIQSGLWEDGPKSRALLHCPGPGAKVLPMEMEAHAVQGSGRWSTSYTVSDFLAKPLDAFPAGGEQLRAIVACAGSAGMSHAGALNVLYTDGSVQTLLLEQLIEAGRLPAGSQSIPLGANSPLPELQLMLAP